VSARTRATATITLGTNPIKALITAMTPSQTTTARMAREAYQHRQPLVPPTRPHRARWRVEPRGSCHGYTPPKPLRDHAVNPIRAVTAAIADHRPRRHAARVVCCPAAAR